MLTFLFMDDGKWKNKEKTKEVYAVLYEWMKWIKNYIRTIFAIDK